MAASQPTMATASRMDLNCNEAHGALLYKISVLYGMPKHSLGCTNRLTNTMKVHMVHERWRHRSTPAPMSLPLQWHRHCRRHLLCDRRGSLHHLQRHLHPTICVIPWRSIPGNHLQPRRADLLPLLGDRLHDTHEWRKLDREQCLVGRLPIYDRGVRNVVVRHGLEYGLPLLGLHHAYPETRFL